MASLVLRAVRFFVTLGCESRVMKTAADVVMRTVDSLNGGMTHCHDVCTGIDQLSVYSASCLPVDCTSSYSLSV